MAVVAVNPVHWNIACSDECFCAFMTKSNGPLAQISTCVVCLVSLYFYSAADLKSAAEYYTGRKKSAFKTSLA